MVAIKLISVAILIALTAFFVASEFAIIKVRSSRIDQLIGEGNKKAIVAKKIITNLDGYLSACQLGITVTALGLGWIGEPTVQVLLTPLFEQLQLPETITHALSFIIAFSAITFIHVVLGELAPKTFAIHKAEALTLKVAKPLTTFYRVTYPFIWALNGAARFTSGLFGLKPTSEHEMAHSEEELRIILSESYKSGEINQSEYKYVNKIFEFDNRLAKEIMVPRLEISSFDKSDNLKQVTETVLVEKYTRYPVTDGDKDNIIGIINMKEVLTDCISNQCDENQSLVKYIKPVIRVIETIPIQDLLVKMQKERTHMAILLDEYGGTAGLVTVEDILEEIVGEIRDEFDTDEIPEIRKINEEHYLLDAKTLIEDVNDLLGTDLSDEDVDTIGGWLLTQKYDLKQGDIIEYPPYRFKITEMEGHHILYIEVKKMKETSQE
ncbi:CBS domain containing-hemolysin-like protein [Oikeobacillus pervagus]|uniref:CBS domain containing-hemolysin-like protein n=1 Tax=Oikeobacillus pervagus TaxID=1325931 RepID=A0AAJ1WKA1_9BACI|nr:hemolysin family protein [Oikeobacillus pervagus]MDQ0216303.1 CBS domain containing-hemolysin-like protein [Oikeobacillus pervagus]